ncbi:3-deoxy-manno-octulosonate cytidylyltransferase, partial [Candidatus Woesearchaeota archaeon]|nr:3-deoxy-manno-octulosonate cytidylyltransferase [Candidatus Woesearchaeota archaeon]
DARIGEAVAGLPVDVVMTGTHHGCGTERVAEVARILDWNRSDVVVNLQGDEPLMDPALITEVAHALFSDRDAHVATLATPLTQRDDLFNPALVKAIVDSRGHALYFSRAPIPWVRDGFDQPDSPMPAGYPFLRHIGLYAYMSGFLKTYAGWSVCPLEAAESLEQLRILWQGELIAVRTVETAPPPGVDTEADLIRVAGLMQAQPV